MPTAQGGFRDTYKPNSLSTLRTHTSKPHLRSEGPEGAFCPPSLASICQNQLFSMRLFTPFCTTRIKYIICLCAESQDVHSTVGEEGRDLWGSQDPPGLLLRLRGVRRGPGLPSASPSRIQLGVEETLGTGQVCSIGVGGGAFSQALTLPVPWGLGLRARDQSLSRPVPPSCTSDCGADAFSGGRPLGRPGAWGGWCPDTVEQGQSHGGAGKEGTREAVPAPGSWQQREGDSAYLGTVLGTLAQGWLTSAQER